MDKVVVGKTYTGEELRELTQSGEEDRYFVFVGKDTVVVAFDAGNDNYTAVYVIKEK